MTGIVDKLFGNAGDGGVGAALDRQERAARASLASATNAEAEADRLIAAPRRSRGGRRLLEYFGGSDQLGG